LLRALATGRFGASVTDVPPPSCDVLVIGAGIIGLSIALHLKTLGVGAVTVVERTGVGAEASGVQPGGVRQQWSAPLNCLLVRESLSYFTNLHEHLQTDLRPAFQACGYMFLAHSPERLDALARDVEVQNANGVNSTIVDAPTAASLVADLQTETIAGAAWCGEDGYFDRPQAVVEAFAEGAQRAGAAIVHATVGGLERAGGGWAASLSDGRQIAAAAVVAATGYDTPALLDPVGYALPIEKEPRYLFLSEPIRERLLEPLVVSTERGFAAKQLADGRVLASDLAADPADGGGPDDWRRAIRENVEILLPRLQYVSFPIIAEGFYDSTPDHQPVIAELEPGLFVCAGFSGHGFMMAPAIGRRVAAAVNGSPVDDLLDAFSPARFASGATISESTWVV
ncbi:MAG: NAD(P)/FAD-dependent oxidoreductase, partial [Solirubrobacteraceae bacterium]